jgi:hypothetical protein
MYAWLWLAPTYVALVGRGVRKSVWVAVSVEAWRVTVLIACAPCVPCLGECGFHMIDVFHKDCYHDSVSLWDTWPWNSSWEKLHSMGLSVESKNCSVCVCRSLRKL